MGKFRSIMEWVVSKTSLPDGTVRIETGYSISYRRKNGTRHRTNGPALAWKINQSDGAPVDPNSYEFWVNGKCMRRSEFEKHFTIETWEM